MKEDKLYSRSSLESLHSQKLDSSTFISGPSPLHQRQPLERIELSTLKSNNVNPRERPERQRVGNATFMEWRTLDKILKKDRIELIDRDTSITPLAAIRPTKAHGGNRDTEWLRTQVSTNTHRVPVVGVPPGDLSLAVFSCFLMRVAS
jgi:hypothetical protein